MSSPRTSFTGPRLRRLLVLLGHPAPLRRHVAIRHSDIGIAYVATFALALLGTGAELFQGHPVGETHAGNCRLSERDAPCVLKCRPGLERVAPVDSVVQQE